MRTCLTSTTTLDSTIRWWLLAFVFVVGNVQVAQATCGDHLGRHGSMTLHQVFLTEEGFPSSFPHQPSKVPLCSGPNCHRHVPVPIPSHDPFVLLSIDAILMPGVDMQKPGQESLVGHQQRRTIPGWASRIFRPPRLSDLRSALMIRS